MSKIQLESLSTTCGQSKIECYNGRDISRCERWFGDDTFTPSKLVYLDKLIAERTPAERHVHIRLTRFAVIEYCESAAGGDSTAAVRVAGGSIPGFSAAPVVGDTVVIRLAGAIDDRPFDVSRVFDYGTIYTSPNAPSSYLAYRMLLRDRLDQIVDEILGSIPSFSRNDQEDWPRSIVGTTADWNFVDSLPGL